MEMTLRPENSCVEIPDNKKLRKFRNVGTYRTKVVAASDISLLDLSTL